MKTSLWIALTLLLTQGAPTTAQPGSIDGVVVSFGTNDPIAKADVELRSISPRPGTQGLPINVPAGLSVTDLQALLRGLNSPGATESSPTMTTSADGRFEFKNVPAGEYRVYVTASTGYVPGEYGQRSPTGTGIPLTLAPGQNVSNVRLAMTPTASISGRIVDADGDPVAYARVNALKVAFEKGERFLISVRAALADDRGEYRIAYLPPGSYYIASRPYENRSTRTYGAAAVSRFGAGQGADAPLVTLRTTESGAVVEETWKSIFYPGSTDARTAKAIPVGIGQTLRGIDISLGDSAVPAWRVRGTVINSTTGQPATGIGVRLLPRYQLTPSVIMPSASTDNAGHFDIAGVLSGSYSMMLAGNGAAGSGVVFSNAGEVNRALNALTGYMVLDVGNSNVEGLNVVVSKPVDIPVNATIEGGANDPAVLNRLRITLYRKPVVSAAPTGSIVTTAGWLGLPPPSESPAMTPGNSGGFLLRSVSFGEYTIQVTGGLPPGAYVKSIFNGRSDLMTDGLRVAGALENPIDIVLATDSGTVTGRVLDAKQEPVANAMAVLVPDPARRSRPDLFQNIATDSNGRFRFQGIMPGEYKLFAWEDVESGAWQDPEFLRSRENLGTLIRIGSGNNDALTVNVIPWNVGQ